MEYFTFVAEKEDVGVRIDVFLAENMENLSRNGVQKLIEEGHIRLNGSSVKANHKLREKDVMDVEVPEVKEAEILPEEILLPITTIGILYSSSSLTESSRSLSA